LPFDQQISKQQQINKTVSVTASVCFFLNGVTKNKLK